MSRPQLLELPWTTPGLGGFTSTRQGGVSAGPYDSLNLGLNTQDSPEAVLENRRRALEASMRDPRQTVYLRQVHGDRILEAGSSDAGKGALVWEEAMPDCDAVFTRVRGLALAVGHADCLAVALADVPAGLLGVAHAGWRGALAGLPALLAKRLIQEGARPERLCAVLSPCLGPKHLELGEDQHKLFSKAFKNAGDFCSGLDKGHFTLDLWSCARVQLEGLGVNATQIQVQELDTADRADLFYSHRRDAGVSGRMMTMAWLNG